MFTVGLVQSKPYREEERALRIGIERCIEASNRGADLVLFPEMWNTGYSLPEDERGFAAWNARAIDVESPFIREFIGVAKERKIAVAVSFLEKHEPLPRNSVVLIDRNGKIVLEYSKVHTCEFGGERLLCPGTGFPVCELDTSGGSVKIGMMICFDREFPESARLLMLRGAEIILVPNACEIESNRRNQLQTRAFENMIGIAMANYACAEGNGRSLAFDGIAFEYDSGKKDWFSRDQVLVEAGDREDIYLASFPLERMRDYRRREVWGNAYRREDVYGMLAEKRVEEPFIRERNLSR